MFFSMEFNGIPMGSFRFPQSDPINEIQSGRLFRGNPGKTFEVTSDLLGGVINPGFALMYIYIYIYIYLYHV